MFKKIIFILIFVLTLTSINLSFGQSIWTKCPGTDSVYFYDGKFFNDSIGYFIGYKTFGSNSYLMIYKTTNRGINWIIYRDSTEIYEMRGSQNQVTGFTIKNLDTIIISKQWLISFVGEGNKIIQYTFPYKKLVLDSVNNIINRSIFYINSSTGFKNFDNNLYRTMNGGSNWDLITTNSGPCSNFKYHNNLLYVLKSHKINKSTNLGSNWRIVQGGTNWIDDYDFISKTTDSIIYETRSIGAPFYLTKIDSAGNEKKNLIVSSYQNNTCILVDTLIYVGLSSGGLRVYKDSSNNFVRKDSVYFPASITRILKNSQSTFVLTTKGFWAKNIGIITNVQNTVVAPITSNLLSNYPNPFNSSTVLIYTVQKQEKVNIQLYDITGKMITTLVNENKKSGTYSITLNTSALTSGIYLAKYNNLTIKLVLIK